MSFLDIRKVRYRIFDAWQLVLMWGKLKKIRLAVLTQLWWHEVDGLPRVPEREFQKVPHNLSWIIDFDINTVPVQAKRKHCSLFLVLIVTSDEWSLEYNAVLYACNNACVLLPKVFQIWQEGQAWKCKVISWNVFQYVSSYWPRAVPRRTPSSSHLVSNHPAWLLLEWWLWWCCLSSGCGAAWVVVVVVLDWWLWWCLSSWDPAWVVVVVLLLEQLGRRFKTFCGDLLLYFISQSSFSVSQKCYFFSVFIIFFFHAGRYGVPGDNDKWRDMY